MTDNLKSICERINELCKNNQYEYKKTKEELIKLISRLKHLCFTQKGDIKEVLALHQELCEIKNRKGSFTEGSIAEDILTDLPAIIAKNDSDRTDEEILKIEPDENQREAIVLSSALLKHVVQILKSKKEKSKRYKIRIKNAIRTLTSINDSYDIIGVKEIFYQWIQDTDSDIQFFALFGLEHYYYDKNAEAMTKEEAGLLEEIIFATKVRETASTCCQILILNKKMTEFEAMMKMDSF